MHLVNKTPFEVASLPMICHEDNNHIVVIIKGTFNIGATDGETRLADNQIPILYEDIYWGEANESSLRFEADIAITKPGTDIVLIGNARSPGGPVRRLNVSLLAGTLRKVVTVTGNRYWEKQAGGWQMTHPEPFESMPLVYENAYGGEHAETEQDEAPELDQRNPVGKGYLKKKFRSSIEGVPLPNLEYPNQLISKPTEQPEPASFGFVARNWLPRRLLLGTYDKTWEENRSPLLPMDFNPASYAAASAGLCSENFFIGGEQVLIENVSVNGPVKFSLPHKDIVVVSYINGQRTEHQAVMDTVVMEPDRQRVIISWRVAIPTHWNLSLVEWVKVQEGS
jgi:hypothetical protein